VKNKLIACEVGPNYQIDDALIALMVIFLIPFFLFSKPKKINLPGVKNDNYYMVDSGRTGLTLLLKSLGLDEGSEVLIQAFSCVVVPNSVRQSGLVPVLCDIDNSTYNLNLKSAEKKLSSKTRVFIIQYPFGIVPNMENVIDFCKTRNLILIEDCAHVFNQKVTVFGEQKYIGSLGYGAIFSFGRDKVISSTVGGAVVLNDGDESQKNRLEASCDNLPNMSIITVYQALLYCILTTFLIRPFYFSGFGKVVLFLARKVHIIGEIYTLDEKKGTQKSYNQSKYSPILTPLLSNQISKLNKFQSHRNSIARIYNDVLNLKSNHNFLRYPVQVDEAEFFKIKKDMRSIGVLAGTWYNSLFIPSDVNLESLNYTFGSLPVCEHLIQNKVLNLPTNINTTEEKAKEIAQVVKRFLASEK
jgi:perosamine synthetase